MSYLGHFLKLFIIYLEFKAEQAPASQFVKFSNMLIKLHSFLASIIGPYSLEARSVQQISQHGYYSEV